MLSVLFLRSQFIIIVPSSSVLNILEFISFKIFRVFLLGCPYELFPTLMIDI